VSPEPARTAAAAAADTIELGNEWPRDTQSTEDYYFTAVFYYSHAAALIPRHVSLSLFPSLGHAKSSPTFPFIIFSHLFFVSAFAAASFSLVRCCGLSRCCFNLFFCVTHYANGIFN
jgi:hypothetical protein